MMAGVGGERPGEGPGRLGGGIADNTLFDASQYEFFGNGNMEEVELEGLDDYCGSDDPGFIGLIELNKGTSEMRNTCVIGDTGSFFRGSPSISDQAQEPEFSNWLDQHVLVAENDVKRWWSQPHPSAAHATGSHSLYRTTSYPEQQQQQLTPSKPILIPKSSHTSFPQPGGIPHISSNHLHHGNISSPAAGLQMPFTAPNPSPFSQLSSSAVPHRLQYGGNMAQFGPPGPMSDQPSLFSGDKSSLLSNVTQQQWPHSNCPMPQLLTQQHGLHQLHPSSLHFPQQQSHMLSPHPCSPRASNTMAAMLGMVEFKNQRLRPVYSGRQNLHLTRQSFDTCSQKRNSGWPQFRSKYMSAEEIENISRMQCAAIHSSDPYLDDYYHQACLAKRAAGPRLKHHFCPSVIRDLSSSARSEDEPHAYLQVDALGRIPFSSVHRPRPLLEVEPPSASRDSILDRRLSAKTLEQEPMLAARITIEDGLCLLLDVEDIDRFLQFNQAYGGGSQLRRKREVLLEQLASSLQLVDLLGHGKAGRSGLAPMNDLMFLHLTSLPKGRMLLSRFLQLSMPGSELARVICTAISCHLRFLFGVLSSDASAAEATTNLAKAVSSSIKGMNLSALSACLAAVACSSEQPPLRPLGSPAGDGASLVVKSVLERATELLTDLHTASSYSVPNRTMWQASFDCFFCLLTRYCVNNYDRVMQAPTSGNVGSEATGAVSMEVPVELLRASLPHTDEHQRKQLLDFARRPVPVAVYNAYRGTSGTMTSQSVPG